MNKDEKIKVMKKFNDAVNKRIFAHHPACDIYDHHVISIGKWVFCIGCLGVYPTIAVLSILAFIGIGYRAIPAYSNFWIGLLFFIPAVIQLFWKTRNRLIKYLMRVSLGIATYYLLVFIFYFPILFGKVIYSIIFIAGFYYYSRKQGKTQLKDCDTCKYGESYDSCLRKFEYILEIDNLELIADVSPKIEYFVNLKKLSDTENIRIHQENVPER